MGGGGHETANSREEKILWSLTAITVCSYMESEFIVHNQLFHYKNRDRDVCIWSKTSGRGCGGRCCEARGNVTF